MYEEILQKIEKECEIRNLSPRTCFIYKFHTTKFLEWVGEKPISELSLYDVRDYILERRDDGATPGYCNCMCSALSFFYKHLLHIPWDLHIVPRMKADWTLPQTLSLEQIEKLIDTAQNIRNKAIIALVYSSGLRAGEVVRLAPGDIYMSTMQVHIRNSKNRGDHWTILSDRTLELLKQYWYACPEPRDVLFVSLRKPHRPLKVGGVEAMVKRVGKDAGIKLHPHVLRHSFATHLIENHTDREYVQAMLGHRSPSSTQVYIHVSNKAIMGVKSPLDHPRKKKGKRKKKED